MAETFRRVHLYAQDNFSMCKYWIMHITNLRVFTCTLNFQQLFKPQQSNLKSEEKKRLKSRLFYIFSSLFIFIDSKSWRNKTKFKYL